MILKNKTILVMGLRNKWSIAYGVVKSSIEQGANVIVTFMGEENRDKIETLITGCKAYECDVSDEDEIQRLFEIIKNNFGKLDGIVHAIAHANTEDLRNDFIYTTKQGFAHANDVSAYTLVSICKIAKQLEILNEEASIVTLTYYGSTKVVQGYNVMGIAKAALEASVRYLASDLGTNGIRVNAISAGPIKTLSSKGIKDFNSILDIIEKKAPLHRNVDPNQIGDSVAFLLSNMSRAITGQVIYADSGYNIIG